MARPSNSAPATEGLIRHGWTVFRPGYLQHLGRLREPGVLDEQPRIALAGDYLIAPNVEGAVVSGLRAA